MTTVTITFGKIGKLKDDNNYVLGNEGDTFQDNL